MLINPNEVVTGAFAGAIAVAGSRSASARSLPPDAGSRDVARLVGAQRNESWGADVRTVLRGRDH